MKYLLKKTASMLSALMLAGGAYAQTTSCTINLTPTDDSYTNSNPARQNMIFGNSSTIHTGEWTWGTAGTERAHLDFDLSSIPNNAIVTGAVLNLSGVPNFWANGNQSNASTIRNITSAWDETTLNFNNRPSVGTLTATIPGTANNSTGDVSVDVLQFVQEMINNPANSHGIRIENNNPGQNWSMYGWVSKENVNSALHPQLVISISIPELVLPDPTGSLDQTCDGGLATMTPPGGLNNVQYEWSGSAGILSTNQTVGFAQESLDVWARYSATDLCGNRVFSNVVGPITLNALPKPSAPVISVANDRLCVGEQIQLTADIAGGTWSIINPTSSLHTLSSTGLFTAGDDRGFITVEYEVTNSQGCSNSSTHVITVGAIDFEIIAPAYICPYTSYGPTDIYVQESFEDPASLANSYHWRISIGDNSANIQTPTNAPKGINLYSGNVPANNFIELSASGKFQCLNGFESTLIKTKRIDYHPYPTIPTITDNGASVSLNATSGYSYSWTYQPFDLQTGSYTSSQSLGTGSSATITGDRPGRARVSITSNNGCTASTSEWLAPDEDDPNDPGNGNCGTARRGILGLDQEIEIFPNPAVDVVNFTSDGALGTATVVDPSGRIVKTINLEADQYDYSVNIDELDSGIYILKIESNQQAYESSFFIE